MADSKRRKRGSPDHVAWLTYALSLLLIAIFIFIMMYYFCVLPDSVTLPFLPLPSCRQVSSSSPPANSVTITISPSSSQSILIGGTCTFTTSPSNQSAQIQWQIKTSGSSSFANIAGQTTSTYTYTGNNTGTDVIRALANQAISNEVSITTTGSGSSDFPAAVISPAGPIVVEQTLQGITTFSVAVTGNPTPTWQWQIQDTSVAPGWQNYTSNPGSATRDVIASVPGTQKLRVQVTNKLGSAYSNIVEVDTTPTTEIAPSFAVQPYAPANPVANTAFTVTCQMNGSEPLIYVWDIATSLDPSTQLPVWARYSGSNDNAPTTSYTASAASTVWFQVTVHNAAGFVTSNACQVVIETAPFVLRITNDLKDITAQTSWPADYGMFHFDTSANAFLLSVQWQRKLTTDADFVSIPNVIPNYNYENTYGLRNLTTSMNGAQFRATATYNGASVTTRTAVLTISS